MVHLKTLALGLLSLAAPSLKAAPIADVSERSNIVCFIVVHGPSTTAITPGTAVTGLQLARSSTGAVILATEGFATLVSYSNGGFGEFALCHYYWLNIGNSTHSYKPLSWDTDQETTNWSAGSGQIITALGTSTYSTTSTFLACNESDSWTLYLQTGKEVPSDVTCVETQLQTGTESSIA
ncbi:hypothetical protein FRC04_010692 [Tulasnella sp. 424]|nr:hypothetical protein FRC04_010692 [Tulasnella sp. 424]KAG8972379.1 hypothetical protein FRC05_010090 [Tulasnella sp. 425]